MNKQTKFYIDLLDKKKEYELDIQEAKESWKRQTSELVQDFLEQRIVMANEKLGLINYVIDKYLNS